MYKSSNNKQVTLDNVNLKEEINEMKGIAIMLEQDDGTYKESSTNTFPTDMKFNSVLSGCIDNLGNRIANSLTYENGIANIETSNTSYCYLYFSKQTNLGTKIIQLDTASDIGLQQTIITGDDLYRFSGTNGNTGINNYICLGTDSCTSGDDNMYRIIGVNPEKKEVKVIKETPWNSNAIYNWHSAKNTSIRWSTSGLYTDTVSAIYKSLSFKKMIVIDHSWNVGSTETYNGIETRENIVSLESATTITANIGILSMTDYYLAYNGDKNWYSSYDKTTNWIGGYLNGNISTNEWTMSHYTSAMALSIYGTGQLYFSQYNSYLYVIRPTMYLSNDVMYVSGDGTSHNPFIVETDDSETATDKLVETAGDDLWDSTLEDDGYRYVGTDPANYVCFGYTDYSTNCDFTNATNSDLYAYRIIGVFEDSRGYQHLKLIKKEALNTSYAWNGNGVYAVGWGESDLYNGLNGSYFLTNETYSYMQDSTWTNKITTWEYIVPASTSVELYYNGYSIESVYSEEIKGTGHGTINAKLGIMYVSDYLLSLNSGLGATSYAKKDALKAAWMHISNNDSGAPSQYEWTMILDGLENKAGYIHSSGYLDSYVVTNKYSVRPVFYLTSDVTINGEGTIYNPYIIS